MGGKVYAVYETHIRKWYTRSRLPPREGFLSDQTSRFDEISKIPNLTNAVSIVQVK
jgi:hypothetical protein